MNNNKLNLPRSSRPLRRRRTTRVQRSLIPTIISQPTFTEVFRFRATSALTSTIYVRCVTNLLHVATAAAVSYPIISGFRINTVRAYTLAEGGSGTEVNSVAVTFLGGQYGKNVEYAVTGSSAITGVISKSPPRDSSASFWRSQPIAGAVSANGEPLLFLNSQTTGVIIDLAISFNLIDGLGNPAAAALTCAGATVGTLYTNNLDNSTSSGASGNNNLVPVGRGPLAAFG